MESVGYCPECGSPLGAFLYPALTGQGMQTPEKRVLCPVCNKSEYDVCKERDMAREKQTLTASQFQKRLERSRKAVAEATR